MAFEKKEGEGSLFFNEQPTDKHPIYKGYVVLSRDYRKGEEIPLALWSGREGSKVAFTVKSQERTAAPQQSISQRAMPKRPDPISSGRGPQKQNIIPDDDDMDGDKIPF